MHNPPLFAQQILLNGKPVSGALLYAYQAGATSIPQALYYDVDRTSPCPNPLPANDQGYFPQYFMADAEYFLVVKTADGSITISTSDYVSPTDWSDGFVSDTYEVKIVAGGAPGFLGAKIVAGANVTITPVNDTLVIASTAPGISDHLVTVDELDPQPGHLYDKIVPGPFVTVAKTEGVVGEAVAIAFRPVVSADGSDVPDYLINKLSALNTPIGFESYNGKVNLTYDWAKASAGLVNSPYAVWFSNASGALSGTNSFTFGDPSRQGALFTPSLQVMGSMVMGNNTGFWDDQTFAMDYTAIGGQIRLTPGYSNTRYIYAHNNENNAAVFTDKASFANLSSNGLVFACMWPHSSEEAIYLHTADGLSFDPSTNVLTAPNVAVTTTLTLSALSSAGVLTNDASGKVISVPVSTFANDHTVYATALDTVPGVLGSKLAAGTNISFAVTTDSRGDKLWISARSNMLLNPTYITANYAVVDTDACVSCKTNSNITVTLPTPAQIYSGRGVEIDNVGTGTLSIVAASGSIVGYTPGISGYGRQLFRCLLGADAAYHWVCGA